MRLLKIFFLRHSTVTLNVHTSISRGICQSINVLHFYKTVSLDRQLSLSVYIHLSLWASVCLSVVLSILTLATFFKPKNLRPRTYFWQRNNFQQLIQALIVPHCHAAFLESTFSQHNPNASINPFFFFNPLKLGVSMFVYLPPSALRIEKFLRLMQCTNSLNTGT